MANVLVAQIFRAEEERLVDELDTEHEVPSQPELRASPFVGHDDVAHAAHPMQSQEDIFESLGEFYKQYYFRPGKIWEITSEMLTDWEMMKRRLREGVEFVKFLGKRENREQNAA